MKKKVLNERLCCKKKKYIKPMGGNWYGMLNEQKSILFFITFFFLDKWTSASIGVHFTSHNLKPSVSLIADDTAPFLAQ